MAGYFNVKVEVLSQQGTCHRGHKVGDSWIVTDKTPEGICVTAFAAIYGMIRYLQLEAKAPYQKESRDELNCPCPDAANPVVFKLTRLKE